MKDKSAENYKQILELLKRYRDTADIAVSTTRELSIEVEAIKSLLIRRGIASREDVEKSVASAHALYSSSVEQPQRDDQEKLKRESDETLRKLLDDYEGPPQ